MPLKLNVGLSKKLGEANYGSRGASVNVEMELESALVGEPAKLQERIRQLFGIVRTSLAEELNGNGQTAKSTTTANGNGQPKTESNGSSAHPRQEGNFRAATQSQVKAIFAITKNQGVNLTALLRNRFQVDRADDLSVQQASALIDELKKAGNGKAGS
jgi:hypothetical protein